MPIVLGGWKSVMSDKSVAVAELSPTFEWISPDWARLTAAVHRLLVPFVAPDPDFRGEVSLEGTAKIRRTFDTIETWVNALNADIKEASCELRGGSGRRISLTAGYSDSRFYLWIYVPEDDLGAAQELLAQLRAEISLMDQSEVSNQSTTYLERRYMVEKHKDAAWCLGAADFLIPAAKDRFDGRIEFGTPAGFGQQFRNREEWSKVVAAEWGSLIRLDCSGYEDRKRNRINWNMQSSDFRVIIERRLLERCTANLTR
jgi:hypothetical protein